MSEGHFDVHVVESDPQARERATTQGFKLLELDQLHTATFIFLAVPISSIEPVLQSIAPLLDESHVVIDLCSVKVYPTRLMQKYLSHCQVLGSHPMFGPDSAKTGLEGMPIAFCPISISEENEAMVRSLWESHGVKVIHTTPEAHDQDSVYSQAFTYSLAKIILNMQLPDITFATKSYNSIITIAELSARDTPQLFHDMLYYNPYFPKMKAELEASILKTQSALNDIAAEQDSITPV